VSGPNPPVNPPGQKLSSSWVVGLNPPRTKPPLGRNPSQEKHTRSCNQMQPLVCNAVVFKVRMMYVHKLLGRNASVNESMYRWRCKGKGTLNVALAVCNRDNCQCRWKRWAFCSYWNVNVAAWDQGRCRLLLAVTV